MLTLAEEFLLLALDDDKGTPRISSTMLQYGLIGAMLMELTLKARVRIVEKKVEVWNHTETKQKILDHILERINQSNKLKSPRYWITKLVPLVKESKPVLLQQMVEKRILDQDEYRILGLFPIKCYPAKDIRLKRELRDKIRIIILRGETPDPHLAMLIGLVFACRLEKTIFDREERKEAHKRMKEIVKENPIAKGITDAIMASQAGAAHAGF